MTLDAELLVVCLLHSVCCEMLSNVSRANAAAAAVASKETEEDDDTELVYYWQLPRAFTESRHTEKIAAVQTAAQPWRMKERVRTVNWRRLHQSINQSVSHNFKCKSIAVTLH